MTKPSIETRKYERERKADYRRKNHFKHLEAERKRIARKRAQIRLVVFNHKSLHPCLDCGESDPIVLEFDHRNPSKKMFNIGSYRTVSLDRLRLEIEKCDIRCANCHRRKTAASKNKYHLNLPNIFGV